MIDYLKKLKTQKQATGVLPKLPKDKISEKTPHTGTAKTAKRGFDSKDSDRGRHISEIPAPEPAGKGPEYTRIWNQAWELAEWIDNPGGAPLAERRAKLPELEDLRARMAEIEKTGPRLGFSAKLGKSVEPDTHRHRDCMSYIRWIKGRKIHQKTDVSGTIPIS